MNIFNIFKSKATEVKDVQTEPDDMMSEAYELLSRAACVIQRLRPDANVEITVEFGDTTFKTF